MFESRLGYDLKVAKATFLFKRFRSKPSSLVKLGFVAATCYLPISECLRFLFANAELELSTFRHEYSTIHKKAGLPGLRYDEIGEVVSVTEKTNAMRLLEQADIPFEVHKYVYDEDDLSAEKAADALGMPRERVFKTLALRGERRGVLFALVPAGTDIDLKKLAKVSGDKRVELVPLREVRKLTGYERGAVTPLALPKRYPVVIDETVELWPSIGISAGVRGVEIVLAPDDLLQITSAETEDIARSS